MLILSIFLESLYFIILQFYIIFKVQSKMRSQSSGHSQNQIKTQLRKNNYYDMLDLKQNASEADIKKSYKKLALKYHPDKNSAQSSKQVFHKLSQAYDTLSDPLKKNIYDQKQNLINKKDNNFSFSQANSYSKNSSAYSRFEKQSAEFQKKFSQKNMQFKMDQRARQQRYKNQKQRQESQNNFSYKRNSSSKPKDQQQQKWQQEYKKYRGKSSEFDKRTSNRPRYEQYQSNIQKQIRLQKQRQKVEKNMTQFKMAAFIIVVWLAFSYFGPSMRGEPVYSMHFSQHHKIPHFTKQLRSPFYVTQEYLQRASSDDNFRIYLDKKIDLVYIKSLSRVCNLMIQKQQLLQLKMSIAKSKKSKKKILQQLDLIDMTACERLHDARQLNPIYFRSLFQDPSKTGNLDESM